MRHHQHPSPPQPYDPTDRRLARQFVIGAILAWILIPAIFVYRFGAVTDLGWGFTIAASVFCLLVAIALSFRNKRDFHSPVQPRHDRLDQLGGFWLLACTGGPLAGWFLTTAFVLTTANWIWLYTAKVLCCVFLPGVTALPLVRYVRGKSKFIALPILLIVTTLPILTGLAPLQDLWSGANLLGDRPYLIYTQRVLQIEAPRK
jgi:ABC-type maltose transport system permease subunit